MCTGCGDGMTCDAVTGDCLSNCSAGWTGPLCDQRTGFYLSYFASISIQDTYTASKLFSLFLLFVYFVYISIVNSLLSFAMGSQHDGRLPYSGIVFRRVCDVIVNVITLEPIETSL